jgi:hypothetical protein
MRLALKRASVNIKNLLEFSMFMYENNLEIRYSGKDLKVRVVIPDGIEAFLRDKVFSLRQDRNHSGLLEKVCEGLLENLIIEGNCEWADRETLAPVYFASFYAYEIGYHQFEGDSGAAKSCEVPLEFKVIGWFFSYIDSSLDNLGIPGQGNIRFASNRLFRRQLQEKDFYRQEVKEFLESGDADPAEKQVLLRIYPEL